MLSVEELQARTYEERMTDVMRELPLRSKEWTNYNASDPGITILENLTAFSALQGAEIVTLNYRAKMALLKMAGFIKAQKGIGGGYTLAKKPESIKMSEVVNALDNSILEDIDNDEQDVLSLKNVVNSNLWGDLNNTIKSYLSNPTLADFVEKCNTKMSNGWDMYVI